MQAQRCDYFEVSGKVQGVFFRAHTQEVAESLGITGWVKNLTNGNVALVACGDDDQLDKLESALQEGPPMAQVDHVTRKPSDSDRSDYDGFQIIG